MTNLRRTQAIATAGKTSFIYDFLVLNSDDIAVFLTPAGAIPNDESDLLLNNTNYVVKNIGIELGGTIELSVGANENDIITIQGNREVQPASDFQPGQLSAEDLNLALDALTIEVQDLKTTIDVEMIKYPTSNVFNPLETQNILPQLDESQVWIGGINGSIVVANLIEDVGAGILRAELASQINGADGALIVGFFDSVFAPAATTVHAALEQVNNKVKVLEEPQQELQINENIILGGDFSNNPFQEGTSFTPLTNTRSYVADGWILDQTGTMSVKVSRSTNVPDIATDNADIFYLNSLEIEILTPQAVLGVLDKLVLEQIVEGNVFRQIAQNGAISLSFWIYSPLVGTYTVSFRNKGKDRFIVKEYTVNNANTWQKIILEFEESPADGTWDYSNLEGLIVDFTFAAGTDLETLLPNQWNIGDKISLFNQVNFAGEVATSKIFIQDIRVSKKSSLPLPRRNAQQELSLAQRRFEKSYNIDVPPGTITTSGAFEFIQNNGGATIMSGMSSTFKQQKRIIPTVTWFSVITGLRDKVNIVFGGDLDVLQVNNIGTYSSGVVQLAGAIGIQAVQGHFIADSRFL